jgi:hypothetical protein
MQIIINEWVYSGNFEEELNKTAYQIAYFFFMNMIKEMKEMDESALELSGLSAAEKEAVLKSVQGNKGI